jgi:D-cysteine desulfhydrase
MLVPTGGSSARGDLGFVSAGLELAEQVRAGELPEPAQVFVPVGTGGTLAGLVLGMRLAGLRTRAVGVVVTDILAPSPRSLARHARAAWRLMLRLDPTVERVAIDASDFELVRSQLGPGYGAPTTAALAASELALAHGLRLETTYGAKCLAAILARAREGRLGPGPILFWHTFNGIDVASRAPRRTTEADLPRSIRRVLAGTVPRAR